jgi:predicted transposase/invertase (TIGR01784 family)
VCSHEIEGTEEYIPEFKSEIFDISHMPDEEIRGEVLLRVALLLAQKYIFSPELVPKLRSIIVLLNELSNKTTATEYLEVFLRYLSTAIDDKNEPDIKKVLEETLNDGGLTMPTIAEKWYMDGINKGKLEGKLDDAQKMIEKGMSNADIRDITGLSIKEIQSLREKLEIK